MGWMIDGGTTLWVASTGDLQLVKQFVKFSNIRLLEIGHLVAVPVNCSTEQGKRKLQPLNQVVMNRHACHVTVCLLEVHFSQKEGLAASFIPLVGIWVLCQQLKQVSQLLCNIIRAATVMIVYAIQ
jgi:hypothetical protein